MSYAPGKGKRDAADTADTSGTSDSAESRKTRIPRIPRAPARLGYLGHRGTADTADISGTGVPRTFRQDRDTPAATDTSDTWGRGGSFLTKRGREGLSYMPVYIM